MSFSFDDKEFVELYYKMMEEADNSFVIEQFKKFIPQGLNVLELGSAAGIDILALQDDYNIQGSDFSKAFIQKAKEINNLDYLHVNGIEMNVEQKYDCIYSNKVLQCFNDTEIITSFNNQYKALNSNGYLFHCVWTTNYNHNDFHLHNYQQLKTILKSQFEIVDFIIYSEMEDNDSAILIAKKL